MPNYGYLHNTLLKYNSTIFKQQLTNISTVLNNTGNTTQLLTSFNALDVAQQKVLLSSKLLTEEQKSQCATMVALSSVNSKYTAEQLTRVAGVSTETLANWGLVDSTDSLTIAELAELSVSDKQAKNVLDKIIAQNAQTVANGEVTASNIALASSEGGATLATGAFTTAIKANISAMWTWMTTTPLGWLTLLAAGVFAAVKAYDALTVSVEEQKEKMEESLSAYEDAKSELSGITTELENQEQAMNELLAKEKLTYAEKGQLEELQAITRELRIQKDLAEKEEDRTEKQLAKDATDLFDKQFGDYEISEQAINKYQSDADITGNNAILISDENDISAMIAGYKQFNELLDEAYGSGSQDDIDHFKSLTEDLEDSIFTTAQELQIQQDNISAYYESIKNTPYEDLTTEQKEIVDTYNAISNAIALIYQQLDPNTWNSMQVDNIFSTDGIEKTKDELVAMAQSGELTPETIKGYTNLNNALGETTLSAQDLCNELYAIADAEKSVQDSTLADEMSDLNIRDYLNQEDLKDTKDELFNLFKTGELNEDSINSIREFRDMLTATGLSAKDAVNEIEQFFEASNETIDLSDWKTQLNEARNAINSLKTIKGEIGSGYSDSSINTIISDYPQLLAYLDDESSMLEAVNNLLDEQSSKAEIAANKILEFDPNIYKEVITQVYSDLEQSNSSLIQTLATGYGIDLNNFSSLAQAKEEIDKQLLQTLMEMWGEYYGIVVDSVTGLASVTQNLPDFYQNEEAQNQLATYNQIITKLNATADKFNNDLDFGSLGDDASKAGSSDGDAYVEAYEKELKELGKLRDRGEITEAEYLSRMKALYERYFKGISKYQDKYFEEQGKYLSGMLDLYNSALSGISKLLGNKIDAVQEEKDATISALEEERDARLEVIEAQKEQLQAEIDLIDEQIDAKQEIIDSINDEINKMREANEERKRNLDLQKAQYNLQKMLSQRTKLVNICQTL